MKGSAVLRTLVCLCSAALLLAAAPVENILSKQQQQAFRLKQQNAVAESALLKRNWIAPLIVQGDYQQSSSRFSRLQSDRTSLSALVRIEQDIFRSGGILAAHRYAGALERANLRSLQSQLQGRVAEAYTLLFAIRKLELQIEKQELLVANADIDIARKEEQYDEGLIDSSVLHTALLDRNTQAAALLELHDSLAQSESAFKELSDHDIETLPLPDVMLISKEAFLGGSPAIAAAEHQQRAARENRTMIAAKYRPRLSLGASYQHYFDDESTPPNALNGNQESVNSWGVTLTVPLDIKGRYETQSARLAARMAQSDRQLLVEEQKRHYDQTQAKLKRLERQSALAREDIRLHGALLERTRDRIKAGSQTEDDRVVMANSKRVRELDLAIYALSYREELLKLYLRGRDAAF